MRIPSYQRSPLDVTPCAARTYDAICALNYTVICRRGCFMHALSGPPGGVWRGGLCITITKFPTSIIHLFSCVYRAGFAPILRTGGGGGIVFYQIARQFHSRNTPKIAYRFSRLTHQHIITCSSRPIGFAPGVPMHPAPPAAGVSPAPPAI